MSTAKVYFPQRGEALDRMSGSTRRGPILWLPPLAKPPPAHLPWKLVTASQRFRFPTRKGCAPTVTVCAAIAAMAVWTTAMIPYPGIEGDEALFARAIYLPGANPGAVRMFGATIPTMLMDYLGALKAWLYRPILAVWPPSPYSLRLPALLAACLAVWLFYRFLAAAAGRRAGTIGAVLLATDVTYALTATFDWGPVALQHLLLFAGLAAIGRFARQPDDRYLALGFSCWGLALWDKALFVWACSGLCLGAILFYLRPLLALLTRRRLVIAAGAFLAGALPLIYFNVTEGFPTFRGKHYTTEDLGQNLAIMKNTLAGNAVGGFLIDYGSPPRVPVVPDGPVEAASLWLARVSRNPQRTLFPWLLAAALLAALLSLRRPRARLLGLLATAFLAAWLQMLFTANAGGSAHHTVLILPFAIAFAAVSVDGLIERWKPAKCIIAAAVLAVAASNILVLNQQLAGLIVFGPGPAWSDATWRLAPAVERHQPAVVYAADWGIDNPLLLLTEGRIPIRMAAAPLDLRSLTEAQRRRVLERVARPGSIFVAYAEGRGVFPAVKRLVDECAAEAGYRRVVLEAVRDSRGRAVFELYRFHLDEGPPDQ